MTERQFLLEIKADLRDSECTFWACHGPDAPDTPMSTCSKCQVIHRIRSRLKELTDANKRRLGKS